MRSIICYLLIATVFAVPAFGGVDTESCSFVIEGEESSQEAELFSLEDLLGSGQNWQDEETFLSDEILKTDSESGLALYFDYSKGRGYFISDEVNRDFNCELLN